METLRESYFDLSILAFQKFFVDFIEFRPAEGTHDISNCREMKSAAVHNLIFSSNRIDVIICHSTKFLNKLLINV